MLGWILLACAIAFFTKFLGYLLPESLMDNQRVMAVLGAMTIGLLAGLIAINTATRGHALVLDSRLLALVVAVIALRFKAPFILVVVLGAAAVALGRALGLP